MIYYFCTYMHTYIRACTGTPELSLLLTPAHHNLLLLYMHAKLGTHAYTGTPELSLSSSHPCASQSHRNTHTHTATPRHSLPLAPAHHELLAIHWRSQTPANRAAHRKNPSRRLQRRQREPISRNQRQPANSCTKVVKHFPGCLHHTQESKPVGDPRDAL